MTRFVLSSHLLSHLLRQPISKSLDRYPRTLNLRRQSWWEQKNILIGELDSHSPGALTSGKHTYSVVQSTKHMAASRKVFFGWKLSLLWPSPSVWKNEAEDNKMPSGRGCPTWFMCKHDSIALTLVIKFDRMSRKASSFPVRPGLRASGGTNPPGGSDTPKIWVLFSLFLLYEWQTRQTQR